MGIHKAMQNKNEDVLFRIPWIHYFSTWYIEISMTETYSLRYERLKNLEFSIKNTWLYEEGWCIWLRFTEYCSRSLGRYWEQAAYSLWKGHLEYRYSGHWPALPYLLSFAAGAMLYVVVEELIPEMSAGKHSNIGTVSFALGFSVMMVLDVVLG